MAESLSHIDEHGQPTMVDVGAKAVTHRSALAEATVRLPAEVATILRQAGFVTAKGPVFATAIVAGTLAAKRTHELIPFCHPLGLERCELRCDCGDDDVVRITCRVAVHGRTGVEMEALTGAAVAALTVYDMCKALSHDLVIGEVRLLEKTGGKVNFTRAPEAR